MPQQLEEIHTFTIPIRLQRCGGVSRLMISGERGVQIAAKPDKVLLKAVAKAFAWHQQLLTDAEATPASIADAEGITMPYVARVLHLAALAPEIVEALIERRQPVQLSLDGIMDMLPLPLAWSAQRLALGSRRAALPPPPATQLQESTPPVASGKIHPYCKIVLTEKGRRQPQQSIQILLSLRF